MQWVIDHVSPDFVCLDDSDSGCWRVSDQPPLSQFLFAFGCVYKDTHCTRFDDRESLDEQLLEGTDAIRLDFHHFVYDFLTLQRRVKVVNDRGESLDQWVDGQFSDQQWAQANNARTLSFAITGTYNVRSEPTTLAPVVAKIGHSLIHVDFKSAVRGPNTVYLDSKYNQLQTDVRGQIVTDHSGNPIRTIAPGWEQAYWTKLILPGGSRGYVALKPRHIHLATDLDTQSGSLRLGLEGGRARIQGYTRTQSE